MSDQLSDPIQISAAGKSDISAILRIAHVCGLDFWSESAYLNAILDEQLTVLCIRRNQLIIGFIIGRVPIPPNIAAEIFNIGISPASRRLGYATTLLKEFIDGCIDAKVPEIWLEVRESNHRAIQLYENAGFKSTARRKHFYSKPLEDALLMTLFLRKRKVD